LRRAAGRSREPAHSVQASGFASAGAISAAQLIEDYKATLNSGPTHVVLIDRAGFPDLLLVDGVLDLPQHAALYKRFDIGTAPAVTALRPDAVESFPPSC
jgi:hypothetical protein